MLLYINYRSLFVTISLHLGAQLPATAQSVCYDMSRAAESESESESESTGAGSFDRSRSRSQSR